MFVRDRRDQHSERDVRDIDLVQHEEEIEMLVGAFGDCLGHFVGGKEKIDLFVVPLDGFDIGAHARILEQIFLELGVAIYRQLFDRLTKGC